MSMNASLFRETGIRGILRLSSDAIAKGMHWIDDRHPDYWSVPYLPIDPKDIGRNMKAM